MQTKEFLGRHHPEFKVLFEKASSSKDTYISDLKKAMENSSIEELAAPENPHKVSLSLQFAARRALVSTIAFWYYDNKAQFACEKKHDFGRWE